MYRAGRGFTLIEVMITVAVIAILAAIAYPIYTDQIQRSRRTDATESLLSRAQALERCFTRYSRYNHDSCGAASGFPYNSTNQFYSITAGEDGVGSSAFTLTATAQGSQANDTNCATFTIDQTGQRQAFNNAKAANSNCW